VQVRGNVDTKRRGEWAIGVLGKSDPLNELRRGHPALSRDLAQPEPELGLEPERRLAAVNAQESESDDQASGYRVLLECKPLLVLAAALALFHLGNAAMLPLYGLAVVADKQGDPASFVALTIVVAQGVMIIVSLIAMRMAEKEGLWLVLLVSFVALPIRGLIAAFVINRCVYPVQILDGIGAGLQSVAVPALVARILNGAGRVNVGQGAVMTVQGLGASLSPAIGGGSLRRSATAPCS
jgi:hypothetical protein